MGKVIVINASDKISLDLLLVKLPSEFRELEIITTESSNVKCGQAIIMPSDMVDKIDEIDFDQCHSIPQVNVEYSIRNLERIMPDMSGYYKEQDRQQKLQQRETLKNISRLHSRYSKFKK